MKCPQCRTDATPVGAFWICPTHGQLPEPKPFTPLRIFLSYGHDANEELVGRIRADLEQRGHDVWFDKHEIGFGDEWRRAITDGILQSNRVLSFLSKHSTRDPGVCRDEIAIAIGVKGGNIQTILVESEQEVQPPVNIGHIQWLDMHDWKEKQAAGGAAWEQWYQAKLAEIVAVVESEESRRFAGEIETLHGHLKPIKSDARISQLLSKGFYGRQWLFEAVERWRQDVKHDSRLFWIMGAPGVGKSAFAAQLTHTRGDTVIAAQFCEWDKPDHRNAERVVRSLAFQLAARLPDYRKLLLTLPEIAQLDMRDATELFDYLLANPLRSVIHGGRERCLIVIDALDEAGEAGHNPLVEMLARNAQRLPDWLGLVVTSRPDFDVKTAFQALNPLPLDTKSEYNRTDIRDYLRRELATQLQGRSDAGRLVEQILEKSEGVFLYVERFCDDVRGGNLSLDRPEQFPQGLGGIYSQYFQRQFGGDLPFYEQHIAPLLQAVLAAFEPLTLGFLKRHCGIADDAGLFRLLNRLGSLFPASGQTDTATLKPCHRSIAEWLTDREKAGVYVIAAHDGHLALGRQGWAQFGRGSETMADYFLQWLPAHLLALRGEKPLVLLLKDFRYLMEKAKRGMLEQMLADFRDLPSLLTNAPERLEIEAAFLREKTHILRRGSEEWPVHKILLQLAVEHADDSPLTIAAERWIAEGRCDWLWLRRIPRLPHVQKNPCVGVLEGHRGVVEGGLALADGRLLSWSEDETLRLWHGRSGECLAILKGHIGWILGALALEDGCFLSWATDNTLRLWNGESGACLMVLSGHTAEIKGALVLPNGRLLSWSADNTLRLWDRKSGASLKILAGHNDEVEGALVLTDKRLLSWSADNTLRLWNGESGACLMVLEGHAAKVNGAQVLPNGRLLSWSEDWRLRMWDASSGECLGGFSGHADAIKGALALADGRLLSWSWDNTMRLWDSHSHKCLAVLEGHLAWVEGALALLDGRLLSWSRSELRLWDSNSGACLAELNGDRFCGSEGALELTDGQLLSWGGDILFLWDGQSGTCLAELEGHSATILGARALADGRLLSWSEDRTLRLWSGRGSACLEALEGHAGEVAGTLTLTDGRLLSWSNDDTLRLWDTNSGACLKVLKGHHASVRGALALADGRLLSWSNGSTLCLWDGKSGECLAELEGHTDAIRGVRVLANGWLLSWSVDESLRLWDVDDNTDESDASLWTLEGHTGELIGALALANERLLSWSEDRTLRLWDGQSGACLAVLEGHTATVDGALELADGRLLSWSWDETLRLWDGQSGACLAVLEGHTNVRGAMELVDGRLLSWAWDGTLRVLDGQTGECLEVVPKDQVASRHPEWLHARRNAESPTCVSHSFFVDSSGRSSSLGHMAFSSPLAAWHADSDAMARCLLPDGSAVVTQGTGQVCILRLHQGNRRISLAEAEAVLPQLRGTIAP